jgi:hypothetical protein
VWLHAHTQIAGHAELKLALGVFWGVGVGDTKGVDSFLEFCLVFPCSLLVMLIGLGWHTQPGEAQHQLFISLGEQPYTAANVLHEIACCFKSNYALSSPQKHLMAL